MKVAGRGSRSRCRPLGLFTLCRSLCGHKGFGGHSAYSTSPRLRGEVEQVAIQRLPPRSQHIGDPVPHVVDPDGDIVDLTVVKAALLPGEDLEGLVLRAHGCEAFFRG